MRNDPFFLAPLVLAAWCGNPAAIAYLWAIWQKGM